MRRQNVDDQLSILRVILFFATPTSSFALALICFVAVRRGLRPVVTITASAHRIAAGDLHERITGVAAHDEVGELARTFNDMLDRLSENVERERRFTADAAHELRTPLSAIETTVDVTLSDSRSDEEYVRALENVQRQTGRLDRLMRQLLLLSTLDVATFRLSLDVLDVGQLVEGVAQSFAENHPEATVSVEGNDSPIFCRGDEELLIRALSNVLENALVHVSPNVVTRVTVRRQSGACVISVHDNGPGIGPDLATTIFHRFRRGEAARSRSGTGLGLAIVDSIMRVHHGSVRLTPGGDGATFEFLLPLV